LRAMPNLLVFRPADAVETVECWELALRARQRPSVLALTRQNVPQLRREMSFENSCAHGAYEIVAVEGDNVDVSIFASGSEVSIAIEAAKILGQDNIPARVVSVPCFELFCDAPAEIRHSVIGGAEVNVAVEAGVRQGWDAIIGRDGAFVGMSTFGASAPYKDLFKHFGITPENAQSSGMNPQMFNSFVDGTKSAIEMAAISNATGLKAPRDGLAFPPCGADDLPFTLRPRAHGGVLEEPGLVEVVSSLEHDGRPVHRDLRWGVYIVFEVASDDVRGNYTRDCFRDYHLIRDPSGRYAAMYRSHHLIGLETGISVASAALRGEATGTPVYFQSDVAATAKKALQPGETLDGEGGYCVFGKLMRAEDSLARRALPIGLAHKIKLTRPVAAGVTVGWDDVEIADDDIVRFRREMERTFAPKAAAAAE